MKSIVLCITSLVLPTVIYSQTLSSTITEFGAVADGVTLNTAAIQKTVDACAAAGGGTVVVPAGVFVTGTIHLASNVNLRLDDGAVLRGSQHLQDYLLDGTRVGLLFTRGAYNVAITGQGAIDGEGDSFMDLSRAKRIDPEGTSWTRQKGHFREVMVGLGDGPVVPKERPFQMIIFSNCRNVTIRDVHIMNAPFWSLHFADCDGVIMSGVRITGDLLVPNNDGVDFTSCSNVSVSDCDIRTGDDAIVITGYDHHFDLPGFNRIAHPSENITVTNCTLVSRSSGIRIGGYDQNPMRNYAFSNITITNSNRGIGIFARDSGSIENIVFSNIIIETRLHTGDWWGNGEPIHLSAVRLTRESAPGRIRNVKFAHMVCRGESGILLFGTEESVIENVSFDDVSIHIEGGKLEGSSGGNFDLRPVLDPKLQLFAHDIPAIYAQWVKKLLFRDIDFTWGPVHERFFTRALEVGNFEGITIENFRGGVAPTGSGMSPILLYDGSGVETVPASMKVSTDHMKP